MALPIVTSITPSSGPTAGGTAVTIAGFFFTGTTDVIFDGLSASFTVDDDNTISATTPAVFGAGGVLVEIINADGSSEDPFPPTMVDSSGNGNDALYNPYSTDDDIVLEVAGLVGGNDAAHISPAIVGVNPIGGNASVAPSFGTGDLFICGWMQTDAIPADTDGPTIAQLSGVVSGGEFNIFVNVGPSPTATVLVTRNTDAGTEQVSVATLTMDTDPHFIAVTYEAAAETYTAYLDGASIGTAATTLPGSTGLDLDHVDYVGGGGATTQWTFDEIAFGSTLLSSGDVSDLYDARGDFSTYNSLMLSLAPTGYYHLDETHGVSGFFTYTAAHGWLVGRVGV